VIENERLRFTRFFQAFEKVIRWRHASAGGFYNDLFCFMDESQGDVAVERHGQFGKGFQLEIPRVIEHLAHMRPRHSHPAGQVRACHLPLFERSLDLFDDFGSKPEQYKLPIPLDRREIPSYFLISAIHPG